MKIVERHFSCLTKVKDEKIEIENNREKETLKEEDYAKVLSKLYKDFNIGVYRPKEKLNTL